VGSGEVWGDFGFMTGVCDVAATRKLHGARVRRLPPLNAPHEGCGVPPLNKRTVQSPPAPMNLSLRWVFCRTSMFLETLVRDSACASSSGIWWSRHSCLLWAGSITVCTGTDACVT